jgi:predicted permease
MHTLWHDMRYGVRVLLNNPSFTVIAVLTLALGIGANTALFSMVNGVLLNPLPYQESDRLVALYTSLPDEPRCPISYPDFLDWQQDSHSFSALAAFRQDDFNFTEMGVPERLKTNMVSATFFPLLGVQPLVGRVFTAEEDQRGAAPVALISEGLWRRKFGSALDVPGKPITLNAKLHTIVGVIPGQFRFESGNFYAQADVYVPIGQWTEPLFWDRRVRMGTDAVGRLKPGVTLEQASTDLNTIAALLASVYPDADKNSGILLLPLKQSVVGEVRAFLLVLLAAVGFVLLIACANVANLLLARSAGRTREFAIRTALGASRIRMMRQVLAESVLLALAAGALGLLFAVSGTEAAMRLLPEALPRANDVHLDGRVLLFTLSVSVLAGILFGLIPAIRTSSTTIQETLREGGRGGSGTRHRAQGVIVAVEMALALVLLVGAGWMIRSLEILWTTDPGFDPHNVLSFGLAASKPLGDSPAGIRSAFRQLHDSIAALPGVQAASLAVGATPMAGDSEIPFWLDREARPATMAEMKQTLYYATQPDYLKVMQIPLRRGRYLRESDTENAPFVIVIDEQFAKVYFAKDDPIGRHVNFDILNKTAEIVGVVGHIKQWGLDLDGQSPIQAQCYFSLPQIPDSLFTLLAQGVSGVARIESTLLSNPSAIGHARRSGGRTPL